MGSLVKQHLGRCLGRPPEAIYHVAIMPCYDKKLEASREDFATAGQPQEHLPPCLNISLSIRLGLCL